MSFNSKKTILSVLAGVVLTIAYILYALGGNSPAPEDLRSWARAMLVFVGIGVAAVIVIQILFHIAAAVGIAVKERDQDDKTVERIISSALTEDERDKLISLKSSHICYIIAGGGFFAALVALASGVPAVPALHICMGGLCAGSITEGIVSVFFYEKGVRQ